MKKAYPWLWALVAAVFILGACALVDMNSQQQEPPHEPELTADQQAKLMQLQHPLKPQE